MSQTNPTHARIGVCALCNHTDWVAPGDESVTTTGRNICVSTQECNARVRYNHEVAARADLIMEICTLCDDHLLEGWGFVRTNGVTKSHGSCHRCAEETLADWQLCQVDNDWHAGCAPQDRDPDYR